MHVTRTPTGECIRRAEIAAEAGASGIALGQPQIYDSSESKVLERFKEVAKAVPLPMMVYNLSHLSHFSLSPDFMSRILDVAPVEVIKDVPTDFDHIKRTIQAVGDRVPVLYGHKDTLVPALLLGGGGVRRHRARVLRRALPRDVLRGPRHDAARAHGSACALWDRERRAHVDRRQAARGHQGGHEPPRRSRRRAPRPYRGP